MILCSNIKFRSQLKRTLFWALLWLGILYGHLKCSIYIQVKVTGAFGSWSKQNLEHLSCCMCVYPGLAEKSFVDASVIFGDVRALSVYSIWLVIVFKCTDFSSSNSVLDLLVEYIQKYIWIISYGFWECSNVDDSFIRFLDNFVWLLLYIYMDINSIYVDNHFLRTFVASSGCKVSNIFTYV